MHMTLFSHRIVETGYSSRMNQRGRTPLNYWQFCVIVGRKGEW
jgi:hypothetical protein